MTKPFATLVTFIALFFLTDKINSQETTKSNQKLHNTLVDSYYNLNVKAFQKNSKVEDIDRIFNLFTDDFVYVHPKYGGTYTRENLYKGYIRNKKNGMYDGTITGIKIFNRIAGLNALVVKRIYIDKDTKEEKDAKMTLFEFKEGKISKIFEYW
ncbi:nuclear transport factor 2 family protein [uncultured Tenacibaculum sp.]|uniref:nuclear transport factor 2 family protein n=1 Tax=uncultured Tenacibaculum sp. TaxID=174713 RepID=UPI00262DB397|nr:nuclear transport factor 2 family protein [uncultured Tenacibaculum sp.]